MEAEKCQIFKTFYVTIFVVKSILFQLLLRLMCSDSRFYFVSVLQNISVSVSISVNEYNTGQVVSRCATLARKRRTARARRGVEC